MMSESIEGHPETVAQAIAGWGRLLLAIAARGYLVFVVSLAVCAILPAVFGVSGSVVQSGSMEPLIRPGDVVLSETHPVIDPVPLGRVVTFQAPAGSERTGQLLHRIVAINHNGSLVTAGDANADVDSTPLSRTNITGRAFLLIPLIGLPAFWLTTGNTGSFIAWALVTLLAIVLEVRFSLPRGKKHSAGYPIPATTRLALLGRTTAIVAVAALLGTTGAAPSLGRVDAAFSARTTSVGNSWATAPVVPATKLVFTTQPSSSTGGIAFTSQPVVMVQTAAGVKSTGTRTVTLSLTSAGNATLGCASNTITSTTGIIAFTGCAIDKVGTYTLTATSGTLTAAVSTSVRITVGPAVALTFTAAPSTNRVASTFTTQPVVAIVDAGGNTTSSTAGVTLSITTPAGATLSCTSNPRAAVSGVATFAGCRIDRAGTYSLTAVSGTFVRGVSASFVVFGPALAPLSCQAQLFVATFSWTPTPQVATQYTLYVNGISVAPTGADGWNSSVQLSTSNVPASTFPQGTATVQVRQVLANGQEQVVGDGKLAIGPIFFRTYGCG